jgi:two-component system CheB/CheR fusion protein
MRHLLENEGMKVVHASSAAEALAQARKTAFDLVLTDIVLPQMDGHALLRALRRDKRNGAVPVIALTGYGRPADVRRALEGGFAAHLTKPVALDKLLSTLAEVLGRRAAS